MNKTPVQIRTELALLAATVGAQLHECGKLENGVGNGHFQIRGNQLVNYWPFSKKSGVHVAGTNWRRSYQSPAEAVALAMEPIKTPEHKAWPLDADPPCADERDTCNKTSAGRRGGEDPQIQNLPGTLAATIEKFEAKHGPIGGPPWNK